MCTSVTLRLCVCEGMRLLGLVVMRYVTEIKTTAKKKGCVGHDK